MVNKGTDLGRLAGKEGPVEFDSCLNSIILYNIDLNYVFTFLSQIHNSIMVHVHFSVINIVCPRLFLPLIMTSKLYRILSNKRRELTERVKSKRLWLFSIYRNKFFCSLKKIDQKIGKHSTGFSRY